MTNREKLDDLARRWRRMVFSRDLGFAFEMGLLAVLALAPHWSTNVWLSWFLAVAAITLAARLAASRPWRIDAARVVQHLDRAYPELEESGALFLRPAEELSLVERLQLKRVVAAVASKHADARAGAAFGLPPDGRPTFRTTLPKTAIMLAVAALGWWLHWHLPGPTRGHPAAATPAPMVAPVDPAPAATVWPKIVGGGLTVTPPGYTGRAARTVEGFNAELEEGAAVAWNIALDRPVREARLVFGRGEADALPLASLPDDGLRLGGTRVVGDPGLYHLTAVLPDGTAWNPPELYAFKVIKDQPPVLRIVQPALARTEIDPAAPVLPPLPPAPPPRVSVQVAASDDYGLVDVHLVATVAKGSGEAVKFREQTMPFEANEPASSGGGDNARRLTRTLDLAALGLEPGDELYFHVEASDNRQPTANRARSETRFVLLKGPAERAVTTGQGVRGVNLVPQYFRSERQIIIDTEKLLADRPTITDAEFRERANDLGVDQQLLRLRYGQLLGEELEGGSGDHAEINLNPLQAAAPEHAPGPRAAASITQRFLQEHEDQDRQGGSEEQRAAGAPADTSRPLPAAQVLAPFVDQHDSQDKATYHDDASKGTMRDALAAMWEAEGMLRTARPADALAPEHRALDVLKALQQSARAYVQHVGFEAAPIRVAERRLAGDATDVPARGSVVDAPAPDDPALRAAADALGALPWDGLSAAGVLDAGALDILRRVEPALTAAATRQPDLFLNGLQALRRLLADGGRVGAGTAAGSPGELQRALWRLLPPAKALPARGVETDPALTGAYFEALSKSVKPEARP